MDCKRWAMVLMVASTLLLGGCDNELLGRLDKLEQGAAANAEAGRAFLADNAGQPGVVTTTSGLQYRVLEAGSGPIPEASDQVRAHYRGRLIDGTEFDSSYARGKPAVFPVNRLIPGWTEALQLMPAGSRWELFIPAELAYGKRSPSPAIPPSSTLVFELELLQVLPNGG